MLDLSKIIESAAGATATQQKETKPTIEQIMTEATTNPADKSYVSFDGEKIVQVLMEVLYLSNRKMIHMLLGKSFGFPQADGTFALHANTIKGLQKSYAPGQLPEALEETYKSMAQKALLAIVSEVFE